jgi:hypothetical protein
METSKFLVKNLDWMIKGKPLMETCEFMSIDSFDKSSFTGELDLK